MDDLPPPLILEILSRLSAADLARCCTVSKSIAAFSGEVRSINLHCSADRYNKLRSPNPPPLTPFKSIFTALVSTFPRVDLVSISVFKPHIIVVGLDDLEDDSDDLYLMDEGFAAEWLDRVGGQLRSISISDFWMQSYRRRSGILALFSSCCHRLVELELKNAWLSVDQLKQMPSLTSLTLEFIRLDDDYLNKVNECFSSLQVLKLVGVRGLTAPKIQLPHLRTCEWSASNAPISLTILAPNLVNLKLRCVRPKSVVIDAPLLSNFLFSLEKTRKLEIKETLHLKNLQLAAKDLHGLFDKLPVCVRVEHLRVDTSKSDNFNGLTALRLEKLIKIFPNTKYLVLGPGAWWEAQSCYTTGMLEITGRVKGLREITGYISVDILEITLSFICYLACLCIDLTNMSLLIHRGVDSSVRNHLISSCVDMCSCTKVRWRWGLWREGADDAWVSEDIEGECILFGYGVGF